MNISRRGFMGVASAFGGLTAGRRAAASEAKAPPSKEAMGMLTDLTLCVGCRRCEWACNDANGLPNVALDDLDGQAVYEQPRRTSADAFTVVNRFAPSTNPEQPTYVKRQCMHCVDPACVSACLVKAFEKTPEGPVTYDESICIGCRYCMVACPFEVPAYEYDDPLSPRVRKCTMCFERVAGGTDMPACAAMCPQEAITFGKRSDLLLLARDRIRKAPERYIDHIYGEHEAGGTNWLYLSAVPFKELGFPAHISDKPYPDLTKGYLAMVPLVHAIWPMLLMGLYAFSTKRTESNPDADQR